MERFTGIRWGIWRAISRVTLAGVAVASSAGAADFTWNSSSATNWETAAAWTFAGGDAGLDGFPSGTDVVIGLTDPTTAGTAFLNGTYAIGGLTHNTNTPWTLRATGDSTMTINGNVTMAGVGTANELIFDGNGFDFDLNITGTIAGASQAQNNTRFQFGTDVNPLGDLTIGGVLNPRGRTLINAVGTVTIGSFGVFANVTDVFLANTDENNVTRTVSTGGLNLDRGDIYAGGGTGTGTNIQVNLELTGAGDFSMENALSRLADNPGGDPTASRLHLTKQGSGEQTLGGTYAYTGDTTVNNGILLMNGDGSALTGMTIVNGGTYGGTGTNGGSVRVNSGGTLSPGESIESLLGGALEMNGGSTFAFEVDSTDLTVSGLAVAGDLYAAVGDLALNGEVALTIVDLAGAAQAFAEGTVLSVISYSGSWNGSNFTYAGNELLDGEIFVAGLNSWQIDYDSLTGGANFTGDQLGGAFVNLTAIPEPSALVLLLLGLVWPMVGRWRKRR